MFLHKKEQIYNTILVLFLWMALQVLIRFHKKIFFTVRAILKFVLNIQQAKK